MLDNKINIIEGAIKPKKVGKNVTIVAPCNIYDCEIGDNVFIGPFTEIQKNVKIGSNCRIQSHSFLCEGVEIGDDVFWGHGTISINDLSPKVLNKNWELKKTIVKNGASIGSGVVLLPVIIGEKALIGAGSIITKDVPSKTIWKNNLKGEFYKLNLKEEDYKNEVWCDISYDYLSIRNVYQLSTLGRIKNKKSGKILDPSINQTYYRVGLMLDTGKLKSFLMHRLLCYTFHGSPPFAKAVVNHINGCHYDNRVENLEWVSHKDNRKHATYALANDDLMFTEEDVYWIRKNCIPNHNELGFRPIAEVFNSSHCTIRGIYYGKLYSHLNESFPPEQNGDGILRGEKQKDAKLSERDIQFIRKNYKMRDKEFGMCALARRFDVNPSTIDKIIKKRTWKHIE